jgi:hypothetical protein
MPRTSHRSSSPGHSTEGPDTFSVRAGKENPYCGDSVRCCRWKETGPSAVPSASVTGSRLKFIQVVIAPLRCAVSPEARDHSRPATSWPAWQAEVSLLRRQVCSAT